MRVSTRTLALVPIALFLPPVISFATDPGAKWAEYFGVFFHLSLLCLIARLPAPDWSRAAGYGWVVIDVMAGVLVINDVPEEFSGAVRLGGHVLAGMWIAPCAAYSARWPVRICGAVTGFWLAGYSFVGHVLPTQVLAPASLLLIGWLALIAWYATPDRRPAVRADC